MSSFDGDEIIDPTDVEVKEMACLYYMMCVSKHLLSFSNFQDLFPMPKYPFNKNPLTLQTIQPMFLCWLVQTSLANLLQLQSKVNNASWRWGLQY